ncbi:MerR family transcriptional regulator [Varibaculum cambriense]|uniref:MerR family transcriptional regulator n=1 Tax=Varibaculum cambriense TaxID=184870 RepID=UPI0037DD9B85
MASKAIEYYEAQGLLNPTRDASGHRDYNEQEVLLLTRILSTILFLLGFSGISVS